MTNEEVMQLMTDMGLHEGGMDDWVVDNAWVMFANAVASAEREACAVVAEKESLRGLPEEQPEGEELLRACAQIAGGVLIADAIRARGQA